MGQSLSDASPDVRQASAYGVGAAAKSVGAPFAAFCFGMKFALISFSLSSSSL